MNVPVELESGSVRVDRLVRFKVERDFLFLSFVCKDGTDEEHETVRWDSIVKLETLLGTRNSSKHGQSIDTRLDVRGRSVFLRQHR